MKIREATIDDIPSLSKLAQQTYIKTFGHTMDKKELKLALKSRSESYFKSIIHQDTILVACENNSLVGFIQFGKVDYESIKTTNRDIKLDKIYVASNYQGKGIGKKLVETMLKHKRLSGIENIYVDVFMKNQKALSLYEKYGFKTIGQVPFKLDKKIIGYDILMKKIGTQF
ncbi:MAG: GNAT family N-acetyltransferase [Patescibacteria group bacterium]